MKYLSIKGVALLASAVAAQPAIAADVPAPERIAKAHAVPTHIPATWTGPYVGVTLGWGQYDAEDKSLLPLIAPAIYDGKFHGDGWFAGVQGGYDHQWGNFVLGVVADYQWSSMDGKKTVAAIGGITIPHSIESFGTARLRGGLTWENLLLYGTVGAAYAQTEASIGTVIGSVSAKTDRIGWAYGVGAEWKFAPNWSFGAEWLRLDFGTRDMAFQLFGGIGVSVPVELDADIFRASLNYRFASGM